MIFSHPQAQLFYRKLTLDPESIESSGVEGNNTLFNGHKMDCNGVINQYGVNAGEDKELRGGEDEGFVTMTSESNESESAEG
jgi:hypothetical protein